MTSAVKGNLQTFLNKQPIGEYLTLEDKRPTDLIIVGPYVFTVPTGHDPLHVSEIIREYHFVFYRDCIRYWISKSGRKFFTVAKNAGRYGKRRLVFVPGEPPDSIFGEEALKKLGVH